MGGKKGREKGRFMVGRGEGYGGKGERLWVGKWGGL